MKKMVKNSKFNDRLFFLYEQAGLVKKGEKIDFGKAADLIYEKGLRERFGVPHEKANDKKHLTDQLRAHYKVESAEEISGKWINIYCKLFDCSADYLFGYIQAPTYEATDISKETGLSTRSVQTLQSLNKSNLIPKTASVFDILLNDYNIAATFFNSVFEYLTPKYTIPAHYDESMSLIRDAQQIPSSVNHILLASEEESDQSALFLPLDQAFFDTVGIQGIKNSLDAIRDKR